MGRQFSGARYRACSLVPRRTRPRDISARLDQTFRYQDVWCMGGMSTGACVAAISRRLQSIQSCGGSLFSSDLRPVPMGRFVRTFCDAITRLARPMSCHACLSAFTCDVLMRVACYRCVRASFRVPSNGRSLFSSAGRRINAYLSACNVPGPWWLVHAISSAALFCLCAPWMRI